MDFVHDVHPFLHRSRGVSRLVPQGSDLIDAIVGGCVQLQHI